MSATQSRHNFKIASAQENVAEKYSQVLQCSSRHFALSCLSTPLLSGSARVKTGRCPTPAPAPSRPQSLFPTNSYGSRFQVINTW